MSGLNEDIPGALDGNGGERPVPPGWKQMSLPDILSPQQMHQLKALLDQHKDPEDALKAMKQYFGTISADLEAKGIDAGFLAYTLYAKLTGVI